MLALWTGFALGITRLVFEFLTTEEIIFTNPGSLLDLYVHSNFLHFAIFLFLVSAVVLIAGSITSPSKSLEELKNLVYVKGTKAIYKSVDVWFTVGLIAAVIAIWLVFSPLGIGR